MTRRRNALILGAATVIPMLTIFGFVAYVWTCLLLNLEPQGFPYLAAVPALSGFGLLGLMGYYVIHALKNELLTETGKGLWVLALVKLGLFAMPFYWYRYFWGGWRDQLRVDSHDATFLPDVHEAEVEREEVSHHARRRHQPAMA